MTWSWGCWAAPNAARTRRSSASCMSRIAARGRGPPDAGEVMPRRDSNEIDGLIRAVIDSPDDDTPRLVCADWYDDHGRPERATLIRAQCELYQLTERDEPATRQRRTAL